MIIKLTEAGTRKMVLFDPSNLVFIRELGDAKPRTLIQTKGGGPLEVENSLEDIMAMMKSTILISISASATREEIDSLLNTALGDNRSSYRLCLMQKVRE